MKVAITAVLFATLVIAPAADARGFLAGAAIVSTTPPIAGTQAAQQADRQFGAAPGACPASVYPAVGHWALQERFRDTNGNRQWDDHPPEPFCDANANGRWDGIYTDNGKGPAKGVHDPLEVRAIAISDGHNKPVVYASVAQIGLFDYYTEQARSDLARTYKVSADLVISANHNESSPDSIGLYGAGQTPVGVGLRSGIDEYFMRFLDDRIARAAAQAVHNLRPARLYAIQVQGRLKPGAAGEHYSLLKGMGQRISDQFPTSVALPRDDRVAAVDTKLGVLQARATRKRGAPIFTVMSLAAHNQEMGNSGTALSADWPGAFQRSFDSNHSGVAMFLVGDNGSEEDPQTSPPVIKNGSENHSSQATQYIQSRATGVRFARLVGAAAKVAQPLGFGRVALTRHQICVPLENNGFVALAASGEFGLRQGYVCDGAGNPVHAVPNGSIVPTASTQFRTYVGFTDVGPDLQLLDIPGEAFPALMLGTPFGVQEESCNRPNPAVPTWHARALYRFQVGLADDLIGYLIPAWGFASGTPGLFTGDNCSQDMHGHRHKLESESVGPTGGNDVANRLTGLLSAEPDPSAAVVQGRFVLRDGSYSHWPTRAVGMLIAAGGGLTLAPTGGTLIGAPGTAGMGQRAVDRTGVFMDYDGQPQARPDITTRGMMVLGRDGCVAARYYLNVFPALAERTPLGRRVSESYVRPVRACTHARRGRVSELQPLAAAGAGLPVTAAEGRLATGAGAFAVPSPRRPCGSRPRKPQILFSPGTVLRKNGSLLLKGRASAPGCAGHGKIARVTVSLPGLHVLLLARGRSRWSLRRKLTLSPGHYRVIVRAVDTGDLTTVAARTFRVT